MIFPFIFLSSFVLRVSALFACIFPVFVRLVVASIFISSAMIFPFVFSSSFVLRVITLFACIFPVFVRLVVTSIFISSAMIFPFIFLSSFVLRVITLFACIFPVFVRLVVASIFISSAMIFPFVFSSSFVLRVSALFECIFPVFVSVFFTFRFRLFMASISVFAESILSLTISISSADISPFVLVRSVNDFRFSFFPANIFLLLVIVLLSIFKSILELITPELTRVLFFRISNLPLAIMFFLFVMLVELIFKILLLWISPLFVNSLVVKFKAPFLFKLLSSFTPALIEDLLTIEEAVISIVLLDFRLLELSVNLSLDASFVSFVLYRLPFMSNLPFKDFASIFPLALILCSFIFPSFVIVISPVDASTSGGKFTPRPLPVPIKEILFAYIPPKADASNDRATALSFLDAVIFLLFASISFLPSFMSKFFACILAFSFKK